MDNPSHGTASLNATTSRDDLTSTVRIRILGSLDQASRPSLVHMIQKLRSNGFQSHISVDLSQAARVESAALAGLRQDLNAMEAVPGTPGGGVSLTLTGVQDAEQAESSANAKILDISHGLDADFASAYETGRLAVTEPSSEALRGRPLEEYSDDELFVASDAVFSLLDDPGTVGGPDLLGRYNDIREEIIRRTPLSELLNPAAERQAAS
jgi:ABC-type transporter Mla MlaB component